MRVSVKCNISMSIVQWIMLLLLVALESLSSKDFFFWCTMKWKKKNKKKQLSQKTIHNGMNIIFGQCLQSAADRDHVIHWTNYALWRQKRRRRQQQLVQNEENGKDLQATNELLLHNLKVTIRLWCIFIPLHKII